MKKSALLVALILLVSLQINASIVDQPDSVYLFAYSTNEGRSGLTLAWSIDKENWHAIGPEHCFLFSDFGRWGTQKRMFYPFLFQDQSGLWHCIWSLNHDVGQFAHAASENLYEWKRQSYPSVMEKGSCLLPEVSYNNANDQYIISWLSVTDGDTTAYYTSTSDFKDYSETRLLESDRLDLRENVKVSGNSHLGMTYKVPWAMIGNLAEAEQLDAHAYRLNRETTNDDFVRFADLKDLEANIKVIPSENKKISDMLIGIFFEDINYAADGGLYAELIQNRDFEYSPGDREYRDSTWNHYTAWSFSGDREDFTIDTLSPVHPNNKYHAVLNFRGGDEKLVNSGYDGIPINAGESYDVSVFAKSVDGKRNRLRIRLTGQGGEILGETTTRALQKEWKKLESTIVAKKTVADAQLEIITEFPGKVALDIVSLFPQNTFMSRKNGLRADLAQTIADIHPRFIRFPGGCVAHGDGLGNIYRWKNTVGPIESRVPQRNIWGYHQTAGLGYFEYFQFCEDIGAEPVPVIAAGVPCQNSATGGHGQQGGIPMSDMDDYVQEVLDLIEWANGDKNSEWGRKRAEAGHPEPFNLKYVGIGNEDLITDVFEERFTMIFEAIRKKYPEIVVIGTVGPFYKGTDYEEGWNLASRLGIPMVDEHYYQPPGWFIHNQDFYDSYDRSKSKVYLGEYAGHLPGRPNNVETALSEALYLASVERNGDVVTMTSYAPLLAKEGHTQWNPDLIYFDNTEVKPTVGYYVQQLYGQNSGDEYLPTLVDLSEASEAIKKRIAVSVVRDSETNDVILKLVNLLPVNVNANLDLKRLEIMGGEAKLTVLKGQPDDKQARPQSGTIEVTQNFEYQLPAYSFSVIRIKPR
jgi:alpha-L-arabinofuranosidase